MATERSSLLDSRARAAQRQPRPPNRRTEEESSLSVLNGSLNSHNNTRSTLAELNDLLTVLDVARDAIQSQIDLQTAGNIGSKKPLIPRWITKYLLLITFLGQSLTIGLMEVMQKSDDRFGRNSTQHDVELAGNVLLTCLQVAHLLLVFFVSFKVAKQVINHTASGSLLAQSYLSTVLLFAGLYTLIFRFKSRAWNRQVPGNSPLLLFLGMLYFSISTATLCGTSAIEPTLWYTSLLVGVQMLTSFVYFTSILSVAIVPRRQSQFDRPPLRNVRSFTRRIRRWVLGERSSQRFTV